MLPNNRPLAVRALISSGAAALYIIFRKIPLSFVAAYANPPYYSRAGASVTALGISPLITGYVLVEFAALLVPAWRPLGTGSQMGRAQLHRASLILGLIVAFVQAFFLVVAFEKRGAPMISIIAAVTVWVGATAALIFLTWLSNNEGLGSGFSSLLLAVSILGITTPVSNVLTAIRLGLTPFFSLLSVLAGIGALAILGLFLFSRICLPETATDVS